MLSCTNGLFATKNYNPSNLNKHVHSHHSKEDASDFFNSFSSGQGKAASIRHCSDSTGLENISTTNTSTINTYFWTFLENNQWIFGAVKHTNSSIPVVFHFAVLPQINSKISCHSQARMHLC
jgi:hypothetical protein